ncbi:hypothetical protein ABT297_29295 [Dactylosporangium sp. NPDC000555]|uniref:hypothetical protein n=1 Tax=Dactylosporangium sp. NPDC000555 TaxID=3154260 RepID=UPI00331E31DD
MRKARPLIALAVALAAGGWLVAAVESGPSTPPPSATPAAAALASAPAPVVFSARLSDGAEYTPLFYASAAASIGTAPTPDGSADRLVLRDRGGDRELRRLPRDRFAQFLGLTAADGALYWAESAADPDGTYETRMWRAPLDGSSPPASLTADTGAAVFFDSEYDLVVADGRLHWVAAPPDDGVRTELRSIAITGGPVTTASFEGRFRHTGWPWLLSVDDQAPLVLANPQTRERRTITRAAAESIACTPVWCRSMVQLGDRHIYDVLRPDGTARRRVPGELTAVTIDNALAGRYEIFTEAQGATVRLVAYDVDAGTIHPLGTDIGVTTARAGVVWWADRPANPTAWKSVDLR